MNDRCKNCGYCPHCGRSDRVNPWYPRYPWGYPGIGPYWYHSPNINISSGKGYATGGTITSSTTSANMQYKKY